MTSLKLIFLDIDGIFNSFESFSCVRGEAVPIDIGEARISGKEAYEHELVPSKIDLLARVINHLDLKVVLSSSWRLSYTPDDMETLLIARCPSWKRGTIIDKTDNIGDFRGQQIQRWLDAHPEVTEYVVIDDDSDMLDSQKPRFVQTSWLTGLTMFDAVLVANLFGCRKIPSLPAIAEMSDFAAQRTFKMLTDFGKFYKHK